MFGVEKAHLNACINAGITAFYDLRHSTVKEALTKVSAYGKKDTIGLDAGPEITICSILKNYDPGCVVITEETGSMGMVFNDIFHPNEPETFRTIFGSDPFDRSNQQKEFLVDYPENMKIGDILKDSETIEKWEKKFSGPASITGATSAITCIRRGIPIFCVIVNYLTQELIISCAAGNRRLPLPEKRPDTITLDYVLVNGSSILFPPSGDAMKSFVTFLGDAGKVGYEQNFLDSGLMAKEEMEEFLHYGKPGGPSRVLYLSSLQEDPKVGFVLANGEKFGEWIHWLPFVRFSKSTDDDSQPALILYEVFQERPWVKEGVLMSTPPIYSIFREFDEKTFIDTSRLLSMPNPSKYRSTLIVAPYNNRWVTRSGSQAGYRQIIF